MDGIRIRSLGVERSCFGNVGCRFVHAREANVGQVDGVRSTTLLDAFPGHGRPGSTATLDWLAHAHKA